MISSHIVPCSAMRVIVLLPLLYLLVSSANQSNVPTFDWWGVSGDAYFPQVGGGFGSNGNYGCKYDYDLYRNSELCPDAIDVAFVFDSSGSISSSDYVRTIDFIKNVIQKFYLHPNYAQVGLVEFATSVKVLSSLTYDACALRKALYTYQMNGNTNIAGGIAAAHALLMNGRMNVPKHIIVVTDGIQNINGNNMNPTNYLLYEAEQAKKDGVVIYSIGVGSASSYQSILRQIASPPPEDHFSLIDNYSHLNNIIETLTNSTCSVLPVQTDFNCTEKGCNIFRHIVWR